MTVGIVGEGPAVDAIEAALADVDTAPATVRADDLGAVSVATVVDRVDSDAFAVANRAGLDAGTPWIAVELGGVGGRSLPEVDAAVSGFAPESACHDCLRRRVAANADEGDDGDEDGVADATDSPTERLAGAIAGHLLARFVADDDRSAFGTVHELPSAERALLPVPGCECGESPDPSPRRDEGTVALDTAVDSAEGAIDDRVGVVSDIGEVSSFPVPYYLAHVGNTTGFSDARAATAAAGAAVDWNAALMKALGEALERYCAGVYRTASLRESGDDGNAKEVPPSAFVTQSGERKDTDDATGSTDPVWVSGEDLETGEHVRLPAEFVRFPPPETRHRPAVTTGLGLGSGGVDALLSGLYEVVERDAAMLAWYSTYEPLELRVDDGGFATLARRARSEGLSVTPMLVTQDIDVPVVAVAVRRGGEDITGGTPGGSDAWPRFATGLAADLDPAAAASGALEEALQNWTELRDMGPERAAEADGAIGRYASDPEAASAFLDAAGPVPADSVGPETIPEGDGELRAVLGRLGDVGLDAYATRLTTRDVERLGFETVRVLVPAAQPLFTDDPYFGDRARSVPRSLGYEPRLDRDHHPFP